MSEINLKNFEFEDSLLDNVKLLDDVLSEVGEPPLFENENFSPFLGFAITSRHFVLELTSSKANALPLTFWFGGGCLRIDIDRLNETFEWSNEQIKADRDSVISLILNHLTGYVLIETRGAARFVQIFDSNGFCANSFTYNNFFPIFLFRHDNYRRLYLPVFSKTK